MLLSSWDLRVQEKTTFLRSLNYLEKADAGELILDGKTYDLAKISRKDVLEIRKKTAFVFQNYNLFANKTAIENILEGLVIARKIPKEEAIRIAENALKKVGLLEKKTTILVNCLVGNSNGLELRVLSL